MGTARQNLAWNRHTATFVAQNKHIFVSEEQAALQRHRQLREQGIKRGWC
jgi:hypothetical protein